MRTRKPRNILAAATVTAVTALLVPSCSFGSTSDDGRVTLQFWSWAPGSDKEVAEFNRTHPGIKVVHTDAGGGDTSAAKLLAAVRAGNAPDLATVENTSLPRMIVSGVAKDITAYVSDVKNKYAPGSWAQTTFSDKTYALPQDVGPMALVYRKDVFDRYGVAAPRTWADFRKAAATIKAQNPKLTIASLAPDGWGYYASIAAQAGDDWWSIDGDKWNVDIDGDNSRKVMEFFEGMYKDGLIAADPQLTPAYNQKLNDGTMLSWPSAVWAPGVVYGVAPKTAGKWALAPLPRWNANDPTVSFQGGSSVAITAHSEHPKEAAEFAKWLNASDAGARMVLNVQNAYPAALSGQRAATSQKPPALMPQQADYYKVAAGIAKHTRPVTWGPNTNVAAAAFTDAMNSAIRNGTSWAHVLTVTQKAVVDDLKKQGFDLKNG
ncbi:sugar ABC transporter substrate-binding protein [Streptomyces sp. NBC_00988]|uniref:ABC transporter substrate-binding protein n=1 Tax=Streptomyces sp. NBC_00988 TaxID=2903704 RepID=UPI0038670835|nr:sugar ABC transporter substrate-binding protein [Streptomyces sp. NBC_00988]